MPRPESSETPTPATRRFSLSLKFWLDGEVHWRPLKVSAPCLSVAKRRATTVFGKEYPDGVLISIGVAYP